MATVSKDFMFQFEISKELRGTGYLRMFLFSNPAWGYILFFRCSRRDLFLPEYAIL